MANPFPKENENKRFVKDKVRWSLHVSVRLGPSEYDCCVREISGDCIEELYIELVTLYQSRGSMNDVTTLFENIVGKELESLLFCWLITKQHRVTSWLMNT